MIHNILVYTQEGKTLYSWEHRPDSLTFTNKILIPGFFSAINSIVKEIFKGKIQRIEFEDRTIVLAGREILLDSKYVWLLISITVDTIDSNSLIDNLSNNLMDIIIEHIDRDFNKMGNYDTLNIELDNFIKSKTYNRTNNKIIIGSIGILFFTFVSVLVYSYIRSYKIEFDSSNIFSFVIALITGLITLTFFSSIIGSKSKSTLITTILSLIGSIISYFLIEFLRPNFDFLGGLGNFFVFISFYILLGCFSGYLGGSITHNKFLN